MVYLLTKKTDVIETEAQEALGFDGQIWLNTSSHSLPRAFIHLPLLGRKR
jgi:hypothetical protein